MSTVTEVKSNDVEVKVPASKPHKKHKKLTGSRVLNFLWTIVHHVIVFGICFIILYPLIIKLSVGIRSEADLYDPTVVYMPKHFSLDMVKEILAYMNYPKLLVNSFTLSFASALSQVISCTLVGYGFARFKFPGKNIVFGLVVFCMIVPFQTISLPIFLHFKSFDFFGIIKYVFGTDLALVNNIAPFILLGLTAQGFKNGLYIFMMRQNFRSIPYELEEAAYVDGAGFFKSFYRVLLPSAASMMLTIFLFAFVWQWTDTYFTNLFIPSGEMMSTKLATLATNINYRRTGGQSSSVYAMSPALMSQVNNIGSLLVIAPLVAIYLFAQRFFVESIARSGIVG